MTFSKMKLFTAIFALFLVSCGSKETETSAFVLRVDQHSIFNKFNDKVKGFGGHSFSLQHGDVQLSMYLITKGEEKLIGSIEVHEEKVSTLYTIPAYEGDESHISLICINKDHKDDKKEGVSHSFPLPDFISYSVGFAKIDQFGEVITYAIHHENIEGLVVHAKNDIKTMKSLSQEQPVSFIQIRVQSLKDN